MKNLLKDWKYPLLLLSGVGYLIYAFSNEFLIAAIGFFILSFFMAYAYCIYNIFLKLATKFNIRESEKTVANTVKFIDK
ncbi:hypothetical protein U2H24_14675 [Bacillus cereus]|nr:hypothetical protein [Bacillus cereus]MEA1010931.1 hypothetical protein [Bacillus cereus]